MLILKNEKGLAMPLVITIMSVLTLLGVALISYALTESKHVSISEDRMKAHYLARSGAHAVASYIAGNPEGIYYSALKLIDSDPSKTVAASDFGLEGEFNVEVYGSPFDEIYVRSTGTYGTSTQSVIVTVKNVWVDFPLFAVDLLGGSNAGEITGGDVFYKNYYEQLYENMIEEPFGVYLLDREFEEPKTPCNDEKSPFYESTVCTDPAVKHDGNPINASGHYEKLQSDNHNYLIVNADNEDVLIKTESITLHNRDMTINLGEESGNTVAILADNYICGNNDIVINGKGYVIIYVKNSFSTGGNFKLTPEAEEFDEVVINVILFKNAVFNAQTSATQFEGVVYGPNATVNFKNAILNGWIVANEFNGDSSMTINYLPIELGPIDLELDYFVIEKWRYDN